MNAFNEWFDSLPSERKAILLKDRWMLANAAFEHAQDDRDALAARCLALENAGELMASDLVNSTEFFSLQSITAFNGAKELPPQHHLAAHDAEVAAKAVLDYNLQIRKDIDDKLPMRCIGVHGDEYAAQLRAKAK